MKIELKKLKINKTFSKETIQFKAEVYVDGVKTAYAENDGHGGCTNYYACDTSKRDLLKQAEDYAKSLPSKDYTYGDRTITIDSCLEFMIDEMVNDKWNADEEKKSQKKIEKACLNNIVWGVPNSNTYYQMGFKGRPNFSDVLKTPKGVGLLKSLIANVKLEMKEGEVIFNKNLTGLL